MLQEAPKALRARRLRRLRCGEGRCKDRAAFGVGDGLGVQREEAMEVCLRELEVAPATEPRPQPRQKEAQQLHAHQVLQKTGQGGG